MTKAICFMINAGAVTLPREGHERSTLTDS